MHAFCSFIENTLVDVPISFHQTNSSIHQLGSWGRWAPNNKLLLKTASALLDEGHNGIHETDAQANPQLSEGKVVPAESIEGTKQKRCGPFFMASIRHETTSPIVSWRVWEHVTTFLPSAVLPLLEK